MNYEMLAKVKEEINSDLSKERKIELLRKFPELLQEVIEKKLFYVDDELLLYCLKLYPVAIRNIAVQDRVNIDFWNLFKQTDECFFIRTYGEEAKLFLQDAKDNGFTFLFGREIIPKSWDGWFYAKTGEDEEGEKYYCIGIVDSLSGFTENTQEWLDLIKMDWL